MSHWAEIDENNIVLRVTVGDNNSPDEGYQWLINNLGGTWIKTSYNTNGGVHKEGGTPLRKNYASSGFTYDEVRDAFIAPKPDDFTDEDGNSFTFELNEDTCQWEAIAP
jgi:hypothetical protein